MRPIWSGALSFGLINIPIKVYSGSQEHGLEFDMLHKKDLSPIRYAKICKTEEKEIPYEEVVKGYEFRKGEYIVIDDDDFKRANAKKTKSIEIQNFTFIEQIDPVFFDKPYFLEPEKNANKAYSILREALKKSKKVAIVNYVLRNKEHIGVISASGDLLVLHQLRYLTELRSPESLDIPVDVKTSSKEVDMALQLIDQLTEPFQPNRYKDTYTEELLAVIEAKLKNKKIPTKGKAPKYTPASDLMYLLKESLHKSLKEQKKVPQKAIPRKATQPRVRRK